MRYHTSALRQIVSGVAVPGAMALYQVGSHRDDNRPDGVHPETRVMVRIAAWFKRDTRQDVSGVLSVQTTADHFLVAGVSTHQWVLNADHVRRWVMAYDRRCQRLRQDLHAARRSQEREGIAGLLGTLAQGHRHRIAAWTHDASRRVVDYAVRQRVAGIRYDDRVRTCIRSYPWHTLRQQIQHKAQGAGLVFEYESESDPLMESEAPAGAGPSEVWV